LSNGFAACDDPAGLQAICDRLQPGTIEVFAQRWLHRLPMPFGRKDQLAGYWWECSMRQVEVSRTIVLDAPRRARAFFEALIGDNLDIGRPANVEIIFKRHIRRDTPGVFRTAIDRPAVGPDTGGVVLNVFYKHSRIKQYLKDGRAMRIETVINAPRDLGCNARLPNLAELQDKARACNRRILDAERAGQGTVLASPAFERIAHPSVTADGRRTPALRFGDPRVQALAGALCTTLLAATGITNKSLRHLPGTARAAVLHAIAEQLTHQQDSVIPARMPRAQHRAHERADDPRPLRPPGNTHALPDRRPDHQRTRLPGRPERPTGPRADAQEMHAHLSRGRQAGSTPRTGFPHQDAISHLRRPACWRRRPAPVPQRNVMHGQENRRAVHSAQPRILSHVISEGPISYAAMRNAR
jgi:hypothetical protein